MSRMLYRALDNLSIGVRRWGVFKSERLTEKTLTLLESRGVITPVIAPPLTVMDGWQGRAQILEASNIKTLGDVVLFSGVPAGVGADTWEEWKAEAEAALTIKCVGCRR